jgi:hypothetical protein
MAINVIIQTTETGLEFWPTAPQVAAHVTRNTGTYRYSSPVAALLRLDASNQKTGHALPVTEIGGVRIVGLFSEYNRWKVEVRIVYS